MIVFLTGWQCLQARTLIVPSWCWQWDWIFIPEAELLGINVFCKNNKRKRDRYGIVGRTRITTCTRTCPIIIPGPTLALNPKRLFAILRIASYLIEMWRASITTGWDKLAFKLLWHRDGFKRLQFHCPGNTKLILHALRDVMSLERLNSTFLYESENKCIKRDWLQW